MVPQPQFHKFRLKSETMAVVVEAGKSTIIRLPPGATVTVLDGLNDSTEPNRQVEVEWQVIVSRCSPWTFWHVARSCDAPIVVAVPPGSAFGLSAVR